MDQEMLWDCNHFRIANVFNGTHYKSFSLKKKKKDFILSFQLEYCMSKKRTHKEPYSFSLHGNKTEKEGKKKKKIYYTFLNKKEAN